MKKPSKKTVTVRCDVTFTIVAEVEVPAGKDVEDRVLDIEHAVTHVWDSAAEEGVDGVRIVDSVEFGVNIVEDV